jgi:hypothetical protein
MVQHEYHYQLEETMFKKEGKRSSQEMHLTISLWFHKISEVLNYFLESTAVLEFFNDILFYHVLNWSDMLAQNTLYP